MAHAAYPSSRESNRFADLSAAAFSLAVFPPVFNNHVPTALLSELASRLVHIGFFHTLVIQHEAEVERTAIVFHAGAAAAIDNGEPWQEAGVAYEEAMFRCALFGESFYMFVRIPMQGGQAFQSDRGHRSDLMAATIPI
jgi:hypothetical protein